MDEGARFSKIFLAAVPRLHAFARHRGCTVADADDLVAATLEVAWRRRAVVPADDAVPWLFAVEKNLLRNKVRATARHEALVAHLPPPTLAQDPADLVADDVATVRAALLALDDDDQEILRLIGWDELTPTQAARVLGCSAVAARSRLHRARGRLAQSIARIELQRHGLSEQKR